MEPFVPKKYIYFFKVHFHHTGCPKRWTFSLFHGIFNFLGYPLWWKHTLNQYIYVIGTKGSQKAQPHKEKLFWDRSYNRWSHKSPFLAYIMVPCMVKIDLELVYLCNWDRRLQKDSTSQIFFRRETTILNKAIYLNFEAEL